jgi:hypothetical protein
VLKAKLLLSYLNNMLICWQYGSCIVRSVLFPIRLGIWLQFLVLVMFWLMYFSQNRKNFLSFILEIEKKSSTFLSKSKKKNDNFENELLCNSLPFPNKEFWNEGNSNVSSKQKILKWREFKWKHLNSMKSQNPSNFKMTHANTLLDFLLWAVMGYYSYVVYF